MTTLAHCDSCGFEGEVPGGLTITGSVVAHVRMRGNVVTCPECGAEARAMEGEFIVKQGEVEFLSGPEWTRAMIHRISPAQAVRVKSVTTWAMAQIASGTDEAIVKGKVDAVLDRDAPGWKKVMDALLSDRAVSLYQLLGFILMLLVFFGVDPTSQPDPAPQEAPITVDQLRELLDDYLQDREQGSDTPPPPTPEPAEPTPTPPPTLEA